MTFSNFLQVLAFNLLTQSLPSFILIYLAIRMAITHRAFSSKNKKAREE